MDDYFTAAFWRGVLDRAVKSAAQVLLLLWGADASFDVLRVDWRGTLGLVGGAVVLSVLTSLLSNKAGEKGTTFLISGGR